jgi:hypothetical protein
MTARIKGTVDDQSAGRALPAILFTLGRRWRCYFAWALFFAAQRFLRAATIAALPAGESSRFFAGTASPSDLFLMSGLAAAHLFRCA